MFLSHARVASLLFAILFASSLAWGQATVDETKETAQIYVDGVSGLDSNPGTAQFPLQTIGKAVTLATANNHNNIGTEVIINAGTYRESVSLGYTVQDTNWPITFEAATNGTVIISGADVWSGWQPYSVNPNIFTDAWPYQWGLCGLDGPGAPFEQTILLRREMIFVNGSPLTQVLALSSVAIPGTFFVDESGGQVYIWPPTGTNMNTATVEVATRPHPLSVYSKNQLVFRGLTFQYANSCRNDYVAQVFGASTNIIFDSDNFLWNNAHGLTLSNPASNITVENTVANHNGQLGFSDSANKSVLWQNVQASYNNWRGSQGSYYFWGSAGAYFGGEHNGTINGFTSNFNQTNGIHWDTDTVNANVTGLFSSDNVLNGAFIEKNEGPMNISASTFCNNNFPQVAQLGGGVTWRNSEQITLTHSILYNNGMAQIDIGGTPGGIPITNWETLVNYNLVTQNLTSTYNTLDAVGIAQQTFGDGYLGGSDWTAFVSTLVSNNNNYWNAANTSAFAIPVPIGGTQLDFPGWQNATGQDAPGSGSSFSAPLVDPSVACAVTPDYPDYWLLVDNPALTLSVTGSAAYNVSVVPVGSFNSTVNLSFDGVSEVSGLSASFNSSSIIGSGTSAFTVTAALGTPAGTYPVTVMANSGSVTHTTTFSLTVPNTSVRLSTATVAFPPQQINTTGAPLTFTITNGGSTALSITSIVESDTGHSFAQTNNCSLSLAPSASCTVTVTFTPFAAQALTGTITIADSDPASPQVVNLTGTGLGAPTAAISPFGISFGNQEVGSTSATQTMVVTNGGTAALNISSVTVTGTNPGDFSETNNCTPTPIAISGSCTITVTFSPTATQSRNASVSIADNAPASPQTPGLSGSGTQPVASLLPSPRTFVNQQVGTGQTQAITLANWGSAPMNVSAITISGANAADFTQTNNCPAQIVNGASCTVSVTFTPSVAAMETANLMVTDDAPGSPHADVLSGAGVTAIISLAPTSLTFASTNIGKSAVTQKITATNTGTGAATITSIAITGANLSDFTQTNNCGTSLAATKACIITVTFTPTAVGTRNAAVTITDNATGSPQTVSLTGTGTQLTVTLSPSPLTLANQNVGTTGSAIITLANTGTGSLTGISVSITGANSAEFTQTNTCTTTVIAGASCAFTIKFTPKATGVRSATLNVTDNAPGSPQTVSLTGTGTQPAVTLSPSPLTLANQNVGTTGSAIITLANTGTGSLTGISVSITGANSAEFTQTDTCKPSVNAGASCTFTIKFTPKATGVRSATLNVTDNAPGSPQTVSLNGTGTQPLISLSATSLTFPPQKVGSTSAPMTVTMTNTGTGTMTVNSISFTGLNANWFAQTNTCGSSVAAGANCTISATVTPKAHSTVTPALKIVTNAPGSPSMVALSATGD